MKLSLSVALSCATLLFAWGAGSSWKGKELDEARQRAGEVQHALNQYIQVLEGSIADLTRERDEAQSLVSKQEQRAGDLERNLRDTEVKLANALKPQAIGVTKKEPDQKSGKFFLAEMMKSPEMRGIVKQQQIAQLDLFYGGLFKKLDLSGADLEDFKNLLAERLQVESEFALQAMGGDGVPKDAHAAQMGFKDSRKAIDTKIKTFLNNGQDYLMYQSWEQSKPERMLLSVGLSAFSAQGEPLSSAQEEQLVIAMMGARMRRSNIPDLTKPENLAPENLSQEMIDKVLVSYDEQAQEVAAAASVFLSPGQLEALKAMQQQQKALQDAGIRMGAAMFGGGK